MAKESNPQLAEQIAHLEEAIWQGFGAGLRNDLLATFGPQLTLYRQPTASQAGADPMSVLASQLAGITLSIHVRDRAKATRLALDPLIGIVNRVLSHARAQGNQPSGNAPILEFRKQAGPDPSYVMDIPPGVLPPQFQGVFQPTVMLAENQLVISATTAAAQRAVAACNGGPDSAGRENPCMGRPAAQSSSQAGAVHRDGSPRIGAGAHREPAHRGQAVKPGNRTGSAAAGPARPRVFVAASIRIRCRRRPSCAAGFSPL